MRSVRPFQPDSLPTGNDLFAELIEARLSHCGEWVRHIPCEGEPQWVVVNYQYIPEDSNAVAEFRMPGANPMLFGYAGHFEVQPSAFHDSDITCPATGSKFEVRGFAYRVLSVEVKSRGYIHINVSQEDKCADQRVEFFAEIAELSPC